LLSRSMDDRITFLNDEDDVLYRQYFVKSFEVQVGLHELLGHGSGKIFQQNEDGSFNFDHINIKLPNGQSVQSYYMFGQTYDAVFGPISSTVEECRAECVGIFLSTYRDVLSIFGFHDQTAKTITYINWLNMVRAGLVSLEFYTPSLKKWGQAHMQARFAILQVLLEAGDKFVEIQHFGENDLRVHLNEKSIESVGKPAISKFLLNLQVLKATANLQGMIEFYGKYTSVDEKFLKFREIVLAKKKPRKNMIQVHSKLVNENKVQLESFECTARGMIQSFVTRFSISDDTFPEII